MAPFVYTLCALMSLACTFFLYRGYRTSGAKLLLWSCLGFGGFFFNNVLLLTDYLIGNFYDLSVIRTIPALIGTIILSYGLITETN